jgi:hypothetical protein
LTFLATRFSKTSSERSQHRQKLYENGVALKQEREKRYGEFVGALSAACAKVKNKEPLSLSDFTSVASSGDMYFNTVAIIADAVLDGKVNRSARETFVTSIVEALNKNIPVYYQTLGTLAGELGQEYFGEFRREKFENMYRAAEKFAGSASLPKAQLQLSTE